MTQLRDLFKGVAVAVLLAAVGGGILVHVLTGSLVCAAVGVVAGPCVALGVIKKMLPEAEDPFEELSE